MQLPCEFCSFKLFNGHLRLSPQSLLTYSSLVSCWSSWSVDWFMIMCKDVHRANKAHKHAVFEDCIEQLLFHILNIGCEKCAESSTQVSMSRHFIWCHKYSRRHLPHLPRDVQPRFSLVFLILRAIAPRPLTLHELVCVIIVQQNFRIGDGPSCMIDHSFHVQWSQCPWRFEGLHRYTFALQWENINASVLTKTTWVERMEQTNNQICNV